MDESELGDFFKYWNWFLLRFENKRLSFTYGTKREIISDVLYFDRVNHEDWHVHGGKS